ncbi:MAG: hypothetical protein IJV90_04885 [Candidatus Methanomethylophilaceae archaeon]|nr:hypothetical protein [Candidatus Methanomethylophilaceae archaeon]
MTVVSMFIDGDPDIEGQILRWLEGLDFLEPYEVEVSAPHAGFVEMGSLPVMDKSKKYERHSESSIYNSIAEWYAKRNGTDAGSLTPQQRSIVGRTYRKLMNEGMDPMPFFRPGYYEVLDEIAPDDEPSDWISYDGNSIQVMAEMMADNMRAIIERNDISTSRELYESIDVHRVEYMAPEDLDETVDEEIWLSRTMGVGYKQPSKRYREG